MPSWLRRLPCSTESTRDRLLVSKRPLPVGDDFETRVLRVFDMITRPVLIGEVSLDTRYNLATCEYHLEELVIRGALRHMTEDERKFYRFHPTVVAYVLVDRQKFTIVTRLI